MAWLGTWANRIELDLDNTNIDSDLTHFPILIKLGTNVGQDGQDLTKVFAEVGASNLKIAVTDEDGVTQLYVEVEQWDTVTPVAYLWASSSTFVLHSNRPTKIYLYYDSTQDDNSTYVGVPNSAVAENVWDANYVYVDHMRDDPDNQHTKDSTTNDNDGTKGAAGEPAQTTGKIGHGQDYDGVNDILTVADAASIQNVCNSGGTVEAIINPASDGEGNTGQIANKLDWRFYVEQESASKVKLGFYRSWSVISGEWETGLDVDLNEFTYVAASYDDDAVTNDPIIYVAGEPVAVTETGIPEGVRVTDVGDNLIVGNLAPTNLTFDGVIDEVRVSDTSRSASWIKATYNTCWDNLLTYDFCGDWLQSWKQRIAITIDHTLIDSDLTHFPVMIRISPKTGANEQDLTRVFDEVGVEDQKIAVTDDTGVSQLYVEVEKWDSTNEEAILWVSRADWVISSTVDTVIYLYYDADKDDNTYYVDVPNSTPAERVWNSDYVLVDHMQDGADNAHTRDSTSNNNDGTKLGANEPVEATGKIGEAQDFDGVDDLITINAGSESDFGTGDFSVSLWVNADVGKTGITYDFFGSDAGNFLLHKSAGNGLHYSDGTDWPGFGGSAVLGTWVKYDIVRISGTFITYTNGSPVGSAAYNWDVDFDANNYEIGSALGYNREFAGYIDEVRVKSMGNTAAWIKATYNSEADNLITFATETDTWKAGWDNRIKITIDHTKIDEALEWFPLMIRISASCGASSQDMTRVFDELGVEDLKIAVTEADGVTDLYVEVEKWDSTTEEAILWVSRDGFFLSSIVDTILYLYYDADHADNTTYVGVPNSAPAEAVWDANFVLVDHLQDDPDNAHTRDSTSNDNDGTKKGANEPVEAIGKIGEAQTLDGANDYNDYGNNAVLDFTTESFTLNFLINLLTVGSYDGLLYRGFHNIDGWGFIKDNNNKLSLYTNQAAASQVTTSTDTLSAGWKMVTTVRDGSAVTLYIDGEEVVAYDATGTHFDPLTSARNLKLGIFDDGTSNPLHATVDELRISDTNRSAAWLLATYNTCWDDMIAFSIEGETIPEVLVDIAWKGNAMADSPDWYAVESAGGSNQSCTRYHFKKGRQHSLARMQTGQADLVLKNFSGYYWPDKRNGPWYPYVIAGIKIRIRCVYDGTLYPRFVGFIDEWLPSWLGNPGKGAIMTITATDGMEHLSNTVLNEDPGPGEELTGTRIDNILGYAGWPAADKDTSPGAETIQAHDPMENVNAMEHIRKVNDSELGILFVAFNGDMTWHGRAVRDAAPYDTPLATFGDDLSEMPYIRLKSVIDRDLLYNEVRLTIIGGVEQVVEDTTSQNTYGKRTLSRTGLLNLLDIQAEVIAAYLVGRYKNATTLRAQQITLLPRSEAANLFPKAFLYDISTRICCRLNEAKLDRDYFIEGVEEKAEANTINWQTSWQLSDVTQQLNTPEDIDEIIRPNAAGDLSQLTPSAGLNWENVDEVIRDDDATYNETPLDGYYEDLYNLGNPSYGSGTINKITIIVWIRRRGATSDTLNKIAIKTAGSTHYGAVFAVPETYEEHTLEYALNPNTGNPWTWAELDALQAGVNMYGSAPAFNTQYRITQLYVVVNFTPSW